MFPTYNTRNDIFVKAFHEYSNGSKIRMVAKNLIRIVANYQFVCNLE